MRSLNRERTNVGRSAYTDRIKSILLDSNSSRSAEALANDLEKIQAGNAHDELDWIDVQLHACIESFAGTLIHEIVHANTGTNDQTLAFENELTNS